MFHCIDRYHVLLTGRIKSPSSCKSFFDDLDNNFHFACRDIILVLALVRIIWLFSSILLDEFF